MPDAATWGLTFITPAVAGGVALWINHGRLQHERRLARFDAVRDLLAEGGDLLTAAFSDPEQLEPPTHLARQHPGFAPVLGAIRLQMFRSRLLLWFRPNGRVIKNWDGAVECATIYIARSMHEPDPRLPADVLQTASTELEEAQKAFTAAIDRWLSDARGYLREISPN